jgi:hypothetical protein
MVGAAGSSNQSAHLHSAMHACRNLVQLWLKQLRVIAAADLDVQHQQVCETVQADRRVRRPAVVTGTRIAEVIERLNASPHKSHSKLERRTEIVAKQRRRCNCFHTKCMPFSNCFHRTVKNSTVTMNGCLERLRMILKC